MELFNEVEKFKSTFSKLFSVGSQALKNQEFEKAITTYSQLTDMLDVFICEFELGKNILKDVSPFYKLCIYGNLAFAYQGNWKLAKCNKMCDKVEEEFEKLKTTENTELFLALVKKYIQIKFQHCAILSQLEQHEKALEMCQSTFSVLKGYIQKILSYVNEVSGEEKSKSFQESVDFKSKIHSFAKKTLENLLKHLDEPIENQKIVKNYYYWEKNPENNEEQIKRQFINSKIKGNSEDIQNESCKRSILGVVKQTHWIDEFNIGSIMHMSEFTLETFETPHPLQEYLFKDRIYEIVIYCSVGHFTIATEMRFIDGKSAKSSKDPENKEKTQESESSTQSIQSPQIEQILKKYGIEEKSPLFLTSEKYHIKALEIISSNINLPIPYISHLIKSYDKHYVQKKMLETVEADEEESIISCGVKPHQSTHELDASEKFDDSYFDADRINQSIDRKKSNLQNDNIQNDNFHMKNDHFEKNVLEREENDGFNLEKHILDFNQIGKNEFKKEKVEMNTIGLQTERIDIYESEKEHNKLLPKYLSPQSRLKIKSMKRSEKSLNHDLKSARSKSKYPEIISKPSEKQKLKTSKNVKSLKNTKSLKSLKNEKNEKIGKEISESAKNVRDMKKKKPEQYDGEVRINHQSSTHIKVVFKKKNQ